MKLIISLTVTLLVCADLAAMQQEKPKEEKLVAELNQIAKNNFARLNDN